MFNKLASLLIKSITETLKCLNFFILSLGVIGVVYKGKESFNLIGLSGFVLYLLVVASIKLTNRNNKMKNIKRLCFMGLSFIISFSLLWNLDLQYKLFSVLYLLGIMIYAKIHYVLKVNDSQIFINKYTFSTFICVVNIFFVQSIKYFEVIKIYFPIYLILSLLYIVQVNLLNEYRDCAANIINEDRNIGTFNIIATLITAISTLIFTTDFVKKIYDFVSYNLSRLIYILLKPTSIFVSWIYDYLLYNYNKRASQQNGKLDQFIIPFLHYFLNIGFLIILVILIYKTAIKKFKNPQISIWDLVKEALKFRIDQSEEENKNGNDEKAKDLHTIRRIYIDVVKILKGKGVEYNNLYTPNEYNKVIENTEFKSKDVDQLVNIYNDLRYGNKAISKEKISTARRIKKSL